MEQNVYRRIEAEVQFTPFAVITERLSLEVSPGIDISGLSPFGFSARANTLTRGVCDVKILAVKYIGEREFQLITEPIVLRKSINLLSIPDDCSVSVTYDGRAELGFAKEDITEHCEVLEQYKLCECEGPVLTGYQYFTPETEEDLPLVVFSTGTHSANNERGNGQVLNFTAAKLVSEEFQRRYPCHVVAPWMAWERHPTNDEAGHELQLSYARMFEAKLAEYIANNRVDRSRVYFIGIGGGGQYQLTGVNPNRYAAIWMNTSVFDYFADGYEAQFLLAAANVPAIITHTEGDKPCPVRRSRYARDLFAGEGNKVYYREYSNEELALLGVNLDTFDGAHGAGCTLPFVYDGMFDLMFMQSREV